MHARRARRAAAVGRVAVDGCDEAVRPRGMRVVAMHSIVRPDGNAQGHLSVPSVIAAGDLSAHGAAHHAPAPPASPGLLEVLWRRRWTLALTVLACLTGA